MEHSYNRRSEYNKKRYSIQIEAPEATLETIFYNIDNNLSNLVRNNNRKFDSDLLFIEPDNRKINNNREGGTTNRDKISAAAESATELEQTIYSPGNRRDDLLQKPIPNNRQSKQWRMDFIGPKIIGGIKDDSTGKSFIEKFRGIVKSFRQSFQSTGETNKCLQRINTNLIGSDELFEKSKSYIEQANKTVKNLIRNLTEPDGKIMTLKPEVKHKKRKHKKVYIKGLNL